MGQILRQTDKRVGMARADDMELMQKVAQKDAAAMRALYERHHDAVYAFLRSRGCDAELASDVVHDAMLEVWRSAGRFRGASSVKTWVMTIARNKYTDKIRATSRVSYVDEVPETEDESPNAEALLEASQDAKRVHTCMQELKDIQRSIVRLAFFDGLTYEEISEVESLPVGTIKSRIYHAKQSLLRCLTRLDPFRAAPE